MHSATIFSTRVPKQFWFLLSFLLLVLPACARQTTVEGPAEAGGVIDGAGYTLLRWEGGRALMIWHDAVASANCTGGSGGEMYQLDCHAIGEDGRAFEWAMVTTGEAIDLSIDNTHYNLEEGELFLVTTDQDGPHVRQLHADLTDVQIERESIVAFAGNNAEVAAFIEDVSAAAE